MSCTRRSTPNASRPCRRSIATTLLRHDVGFRGVLWGDDLSMRAVSDYLTPLEAAVAAIAAGVDGVLVVHDLELGRRAKQQLLAAVEGRDAPARRLREAAQRIASVPARRAAAPSSCPATPTPSWRSAFGSWRPRNAPDSVGGL